MDSPSLRLERLLLTARFVFAGFCALGLDPVAPALRAVRPMRLICNSLSILYCMALLLLRRSRPSYRQDRHACSIHSFCAMRFVSIARNEQQNTAVSPLAI